MQGALSRTFSLSTLPDSIAAWTYAMSAYTGGGSVATAGGIHRRANSTGGMFPGLLWGRGSPYSRRQDSILSRASSWRQGPMLVQTHQTESGVERLDEYVVRRPARTAEVQLHLVPVCPWVQVFAVESGVFLVLKVKARLLKTAPAACPEPEPGVITRTLHVCGKVSPGAWKGAATMSASHEDCRCCREVCQGVSDVVG